MATFPLTQSPTLASYSESTQSSIIRSQTEGIIKQAVRYSSNYITYDVTYMLSDTELDTWRTFFTDTISRGATSFDWVEPSTGDTVDARIINGEWGLSINAPNVNVIKFTLEVFQST